MRCSPSPFLDRLTFLLHSCSHPTLLHQLHAAILTTGAATRSLLTSLALRYLSLDLLDSAHRLLLSIPNPTISLWNILIRSHTSAGFFHLSLHIYTSMLASGARPDRFTFPFALNSCAGLAHLRLGRALHHHCLRAGCAGNPFTAAALVDMYAKCGHVSDARKVFDEMPQRDLVCWTSMISAYAHNGSNAETLEFFRLMLDYDIRPNRVALLSAVLACGNVGARRAGELFHGFVIRLGYEHDTRVITAVVDMYAKCGDLEIARAVFDSSTEKDVVCWSAMIACYGFYGRGRDAIGVFEEMVEAGVEPNEVTFTSILSACGHAGLLEEGRGYFEAMHGLYGVPRKLNHYSCMVDLLGRAGKLLEAENMIETMPLEPDSSLWCSLLAACKIHGNSEVGERVADRIFELDSSKSGYYVLLSNIYAMKGRWKDVERVRGLMVRREVSKGQGLSLIEIHGEVHRFRVDERDHPEQREIYGWLEELAGPIKQMGYVPLTEFALHDVEEEAKEASLASHSERLAIAYGMLKVQSGCAICVVKNLRICGDCHNWTKIVSKISNRVIIIRDMKRFHRFVSGTCSCGDYW